MDIIPWAKEYGDEERQRRFSGRFVGYDKSLISPMQYKQTSLPVVLLLADSIFGGNCFLKLQNKLKGKVNISYIQHPHHCKNIHKWLDIWGIDQWKHYDIIIYSEGLHGFPNRVSEQEHEIENPKLIKRLQKNSKLIWCKCTPIPETMPQGLKNSKRGPNSREQITTNQSVINRNKTLEKEMNRYNIKLIDLYSPLKSLGKSVQKASNDIHFNDKGENIISDIVSKEIINEVQNLT